MSLPKLDTTFLVLDQHQACTPIPVTPGLYAGLDEQFNGFAGCNLVAEHAFDADWTTWEMHPHGDEVLYLVSGAAMLHLHEDEGERIITFNTPGSFVVIPKGVWHTAKVASACRILFITPGQGTLNQVQPGKNV